MSRPHVLVILDGFGLQTEKKGNAIAQANLPNIRHISEYFPGAALQASGIAVGIMWGEVGNSEVGHTNIGAGLVIYQHLPRINIAIENGDFASLPAWEEAIKHARENKSSIHITGLLSNGGVHSHIDHLFAILNALKKLGCDRPVFIHAFMDGRDVPPKTGSSFIELLEKALTQTGLGKVASITGRYWGMDRGEKWDRTERAYRAMTGNGEKTARDAEGVIKQYYSEEINDELMPGTTIVSGNEPIGAIKDGDSLICFNYRPDRMRQIIQPFLFPNFKEFPVTPLKNLKVFTMTEYDATFPVAIAFPPQYITNPIAKVVSDAGLKQYHVAEKEKYAHVTYFMNGGREAPFPKEDRFIVPSAANVTDFDQKPEMSAAEIADRALEAIDSGKYDFIAINFANGDMVGHTGNLPAAIKGLEVMDECVGKIFQKVMELNGALYITADHGNCEEMINLETGSADTEHSTNPVPFWIAAKDLKKSEPTKPTPEIITTGILADVAPTIIDFMGLRKPKEMTGASLRGVIGEMPLP